MEQSIIIDLIGQSYDSADKSYSSQQSINWYVKGPEDKDAKTTNRMVPLAGSNIGATLAPLNGFGCRGNYYSSSGYAPDFASQLYTVNGNTAFRMHSDGSSKILGTINASTNPVSMTDNGFNVFIADGTSIFKSLLLADDSTATVSAIPLPFIPGTSDPIKPTSLAFSGQRIITNASNSNQWFYSDLAGNTFAADAFYSAEQSADVITALTNLSGNIWIFGPRSYEIWRGTGINDDPFAWVGGSATQIGTRAPYSVATISDRIFFLGSSDVGDNSVFMGQGQSVERISTEPIEAIIAGFSDKDQAIGYCYQDTGEVFYVLTFALSNRTFCYEAGTQMWHERSTRDINTGSDSAWRPVFAVRAYDKTYFGTLSDSYLCTLDGSKYTEYDGRQIVRTRVSPILYQELDNWLLRQLVIDMEVGSTALLQGQGADPKLMVSISRDGGYTYGSWRLISIGKQGEYRRRVKANGLGIGRNVVIKIQYSDPTPCTVYQARLTVDKCGRT